MGVLSVLESCSLLLAAGLYPPINRLKLGLKGVEGSLRCLRSPLYLVFSYYEETEVDQLLKNSEVKRDTIYEVRVFKNVLSQTKPRFLKGQIERNAIYINSLKGIFRLSLIFPRYIFLKFLKM